MSIFERAARKLFGFAYGTDGEYTEEYEEYDEEDGDGKTYWPDKKEIIQHLRYKQINCDCIDVVCEKDQDDHKQRVKIIVSKNSLGKAYFCSFEFNNEADIKDLDFLQRTIAEFLEDSNPAGYA